MIEQLIKMSNIYGSNNEFVLAGGGNTSMKDDDKLVVKASGYRLADIDAKGFVSLDRHQLAQMWSKAYSDETAIREREVLDDLMTARFSGETNRPSVETQLHDLFPFRFVLHLHPTKVNAVTCGKQGESWVNKHLPKNVVWIAATKPGYILAMTCKSKMEAHEKKYHIAPQVLLLENHGVFFAADTTEEIDELVATMMNKINQDITSNIDFAKTTLPNSVFEKGLNVVKHLDESKFVVFEKNKAIDHLLEDANAYQTIKTAFTPDHVVYCRHEPLYTTVENLEVAYQAYTDKFGFPPRVILVKSLGMFTIGDSEKQAENARLLFLDQIKIGHYSQFFGGPQPMTDDDIQFILNWEVEHYRFKVLSK